MSGNPKSSPHYSATNETRKRKRTNLTLAVETLAALDELSARTGQSRSQVVDDAVLTHLLRNFDETSGLNKSTSKIK